MDGSERRRTKRKDINLKGSFGIKDESKYRLHIYKEPADLTLVDVAAMGCGFVTAYYLPKGLLIQMKIRAFPVITGKGPVETQDIEIIGRIMSCRTAPTRVNRVGMEFTDIKEEHLGLIKRYISQES